MADVQITDKKTLSDEKYPLKQFSYQIPDPEGKLIDRKSEIYYRPDAVGVLLHDEEKKTFLFTRQFRLATYLNGNDSGYLLETCAGIMDEAETPEQTAIREVKEETGYDISDLKRVAAVYTSAGGITEYVYLYTAAYKSEQDHNMIGGLHNEGEYIQLVEIPIDQARQMVQQSQIKDAKTLMLLQNYFLFQ